MCMRMCMDMCMRMCMDMCMRMLLTYLLPVIKVTVMAADVIVITPQMVCKSRDWYQNDRL